MTGLAYRVPSNDVSVVDLNVILKKPTTLEDVNLNGADVITYTLEENGIKAIGVAYSTTDDAQTISFTFAPVTEANEKLVTMMVASLQAAK